MKPLFTKIYSVTTTFLLGLLLTGTVITSEHTVAISSALGHEISRIETVDGENVDSEYYKSKYSNVNDLINAGKGYLKMYDLPQLSMQIDIITLVGHPDGFKLEHIEDAISPKLLRRHR